MRYSSACVSGPSVGALQLGGGVVFHQEVCAPLQAAQGAFRGRSGVRRIFGVNSVTGSHPS